MVRLLWSKRVQKFLSNVFSFGREESEPPLFDKKHHKEPLPGPENIRVDIGDMHNVPYNDIYRGSSPKENPEIIIAARPSGMRKDATFPSRRNKSIRVRVMTNAPKVSIFEAKNNSPHYQPGPNESFGSKIKRYRRARKWNVGKLLSRLKILNLPKSFISSIEDYSLIPDPNIVERLAYVLGASRKEFMNAAYGDLVNQQNQNKPASPTGYDATSKGENGIN